jgi:aminoglycoside phosphotransferase (APT) family kinase protein
MPGRVVEADRSDEALAGVCRRLGYDVRGAVLLRRGTNAVYRLVSVPVIVRVAPLGAASEGLGRQVAVSRWLAGVGVPAVRALDVEQPVLSAGHLVTLWESVGDRAADDLDQYGTTYQLGRVLRKLHATDAPANLHLPRLAPLERVASGLTNLGHLSSTDRDLLDARAEGVEQRYQALSFVLASGPIHGDANVGNLLRTRDGGAVLSDLDGFSIGPREWDLVLTAMFADRYGWHTEAEYQAFAGAYGYDLRQWAGYETLADVRELLMVLWNAGNAATSSEHAAELSKRLQSLRSGEGRDHWSPL